ncbi:CBS domain-containing protein [Parapedobacter tibetensis]|uniref:CBS domain-containing protein n=1 Tax=Parapedobacter tibetensis TaxID=2972951 RepID=UPI00214DDCC2|nr:CBS domain-containing protein [Parapedobacter tibetensis]
MGKKLSVVDVFHRSSLTVDAKDRLSKVSTVMKQHGLKHIPVARGSKIIGIISRRDIQRLGFGYVYDNKDDIELGMFDMLQADQVMTRVALMVSPDTTIAEVAEIFAVNDLIALPVVDHANIIGTIGIHEVLSLLVANP